MITKISNSIRYFSQTKLLHPRRYSTEIKANGKLEAFAKSISDKGFLRPYKNYEAPTNVAERVHGICDTLNIKKNNNYTIESLEEKFKLLKACFDEFRHSVPNSQVHELKTVGDIVQFYKISINTTTPYECLKQMQLPENLHVQYDYVRFNPEKDTMFNGQTAFPKSSTLVTGLKYRGKYEGYEAKTSWP